MLTLTDDLPAPLLDLINLSASVDGETIVFRPDDRIAFVSDAARRRYPFADFSAGTQSFSSLFWGTLEHGMTSPQALRIDPDGYLTMAQAVRRANDALDFQKLYAGAHLLCHHRRLPGGWSAQVRVDLRSPRMHGLLDSTQPLNLLEAMRHVQFAARLHAAMNRLPVGVLFVDQDARLVWRNDAASEALQEARALAVDDGRLHLPDPFARTSFAIALRAVLTGTEQTQRYVACPDGERTRLLSITRSAMPDEAMVLLAPVDAPDASVVEALATLGLSQAECRVALAIGSGGSPAEVAEATGKQESTIRRQLGAVYQKLSSNMGVSSQRALAKLVGQVASIAGVSRRFFH